MTKTRYGVSIWTDRLPKYRRLSFPRHRGHLEVDVAIVGGGLAGCAIAYAFGAAGVRAALFESDRIASGGTQFGLGLILPHPPADFLDIRGTYGLKAARDGWQETRHAALDAASTMRRLGMRVDLAVDGALMFATTAEDAAGLRRRYQAMRDAGVEASWLPGAVVRRDTAVSAAGALRLPKAGQCDPLRACLGFARAAADRGAAIFEQSTVTRVRGGRKVVEIKTTGGSVQSKIVVIATGAPTRTLYKPLIRHLDVRERYAVVTERLPAAVRRETGSSAAIVLDVAKPPHVLSRLRDGRILIAGADQDPTLESQRGKVLVQRAGQLMYELSLIYPAVSGTRPEYGWSIPVATARDGLPFLGPHRNYGRHLFALGLGGNVAYAQLAARILVRRYFDAVSRADEAFGFARVLGD